MHGNGINLWVISLNFLFFYSPDEWAFFEGEGGEDDEL